MWKFEQRMTIQLLTHLVEQEGGKEKFPVLLELLRKHQHVKYIQHLPRILSLQQRLVHFFHYTDLQDWTNVSVTQFANYDLPEEEKSTFLENVRLFHKIWTHLKETSSKSSSLLLDHDGAEYKILDLLPKEPSIVRAVTKYLVKKQNDYINSAIPTENRNIKAGEVRPCHVITCNPEQDFLQIAISNTDYVINEDGSESTNYNLKTLENQLVNRYISEKPLIDIQTCPIFEFNAVRTLCKFFTTVKDQLEPLKTNDKEYINELRFLNEISAALATLKIAIGFLQLSFGHPDMLLVDYMKKELRMEDRAKHLDLPVLRTSKVKHIQCLWEVLSARRSVLLVEMNQNPFFMIDKAFHATISDDVKNTLNTKFSVYKNIELFITELHDLIMNVDSIEANPHWSIEETFEPFLEGKKVDDSCITDLLNPVKDLKMENIIFVWKQAVHSRTPAHL
ncbi:E3 ubiquitin-protein ligase RNF213-like [Arapaima gigas]